MKTNLFYNKKSHISGIFTFMAGLLLITDDDGKFYTVNS
jgi:hypothetical protein